MAGEITRWLDDGARRDRADRNRGKERREKEVVLRADNDLKIIFGKKKKKVNEENQLSERSVREER